ncbi:MAG: fumarate hydratase [PVC group bacterium]
MRTITAASIIDTVARLCREANCRQNDDLTAALRRAREKEESPDGRKVLDELLDNVAMAAANDAPLCQDTGTAVVFLELGQDLHVAGGDLEQAVEEGVRKGYRDGYLRSSIVSDPLRRRNTGDNTPAVIHTRIVPGDRLKITVAAKGAGSENMSAVRMMTPAAGREEIIGFVAGLVSEAGANACPPVIAGIGLGGNFETAPLLAKKALLLPIGRRHPDPFYAEMEEAVIEKLNRTGIGPGGLGGRITCLDCHILTLPCHIASLPVALNLDCCVARHKTAGL